MPVEQLKEPENHFARTAEVKGWSATARADPTKQIRITVAVKQQNKDELNRVLYAVSTPGTAEYGHFLTNAEVNELVKPSADSVSHVMEWLNGATGIATSPNSDFVRATVTVAQAEALVGAEYWTYTHADTGKTIVRIGGNAEYSVPEEVAEHVDFVAPTLTFPALSSHTDASAKENLEKVQLGDDDYALISPPVLRAMYNLSESDRGAGDASTLKQGVASFLGEYYDMKDLESFREKYRVTLPNDLPTFTDVPEDQSHKPPGYEASLDVQWITTSGDQIVTEHWSTTGRVSVARNAWPAVVLHRRDLTMALMHSLTHSPAHPTHALAYSPTLPIHPPRPRTIRRTSRSCSGSPRSPMTTSLRPSSPSRTATRRLA